MKIMFQCLYSVSNERDPLLNGVLSLRVPQCGVQVGPERRDAGVRGAVRAEQLRERLQRSQSVCATDTGFL